MIPWHGGMMHYSFACHGMLFHLSHMAQWSMVFPWFKGSTANFPTTPTLVVFPQWILTPNTHTHLTKSATEPHLSCSVFIWLPISLQLLRGTGVTPQIPHWWPVQSIEPLCSTYILSRARVCRDFSPNYSPTQATIRFVSHLFQPATQCCGNGTVWGMVCGIVPTMWHGSPSQIP